GGRGQLHQEGAGSLRTPGNHAGPPARPGTQHLVQPTSPGPSRCRSGSGPSPSGPPPAGRRRQPGPGPARTRRTPPAASACAVSAPVQPVAPYSTIRLAMTSTYSPPPYRPKVLAARAGGRYGSAGEFSDAEGEVPVPHPVPGEAHRDQARPFQPVRHFQAADVQRAQPEALAESLDTRLGTLVVPSEKDVGTAFLQDMTENRVERLHHAGAGRRRLGGFLRDRGALGAGQPGGRGIEGVADVDDDLARERISVLGDDRDDTLVQQGQDDDVPGRDGAPRSRRGAAAESLDQVSGLGLITAHDLDG